MTLHTRRDFLRTAGLAVLAPPRPQGITFAVVSDLHYRDERCRPWFRKVVAHLRALRPRPAFVMLAGDLSEDGKPEQLRTIRALFSQLPMPVRTVIGNHDYSLEGDRSAYEATFEGPLNYRFAHGEWQFLALNTTEGRKVYRTRISADTLAWVDRELPRLSHTKPLIVLTHFPLGPNWLRPLNARDLTRRLEGHHFVAALSGHWHGWTENDIGEAHVSTGRCCSWWRKNHDGSDEKGYTLCQYSPEPAGLTLSRQFVPVSFT